MNHEKFSSCQIEFFLKWKNNNVNTWQNGFGVGSNFLKFLRFKNCKQIMLRQRFFRNLYNIYHNLWWWQWCWWHRYVGDFTMVTDLRCWWQNHFVGDFFRYIGDFLNVLNRSPTSWIGHQHLKLVTNTFGLQHPSPTSM